MIGVSKSKSKGLDCLGPFPTTLNFSIPECLQTVAFAGEVEKFHLIDSGQDDPKRIIGFTTFRLLRILCKSPTAQGDGTFGTVPLDSFYQI